MTPDLLDQQLTVAFDAAHDDERWAGAAWSDPLARVRSEARRDRVRRASAAGVGLAVLAAGAVVGVHAWHPAKDRVGVVQPLTGGGSGLDWLLTPDAYQRFSAAHPSPSAAPHTGPSPVPTSAELTQLRADLDAVLPSYDVVRFDAADSGDPGHSTVWLKLTDGTPVAVERYQLTYPIRLGAQGAEVDSAQRPEGVSGSAYTAPATWADGSAYTLVTGDTMGYGFDGDQWNGPTVWSVTSDGIFTMITAPVSSDRLVGWAQQVDAHFTTG